MKKLTPLMLAVSFLIMSSISTVTAQKKAPDYKISKIAITPFDAQTGKFDEEYTTKSERSFFNDLAISLFVVVEITGEAGSFEVGRKLEVVVMEGNKVKSKTINQVDLIGGEGKLYTPIWVYPAMCSDVKITARIIGQKTISTMKRSVPFLCGE